jgi:uncharacterized MnhB-related membrane protein
MADFLPKFKPGQSWTATTSAAVTGGKLLEVSGDGTVAHAGANSVSVVGVAAWDAASGDKVTVYSGGIAVLVSSGAITAGSKVVAGAAGVVTALAAVTTPTAADVTNTRAIVGTALTTAANNLVTVQFVNA